jgi:hypothetical protein
MVQPNIGWIQPDSEFIEVANQGFTHEAYAADVFDRQGVDWRKRHMIPSLELLKMGWVRYTGGSIEGMPKPIAAQWFTIRRLVEDDLASNAYKLHANAYFDVYPVDPYDHESRKTFKVPMTQMLKPHPPAGVFREPSLIQEFHRHPRSLRNAQVAVHRHRRRR